MAVVGFPVESGFVESLARPGGNITGVAVRGASSGELTQFVVLLSPEKLNKANVVVADRNTIDATLFDPEGISETVDGEVTGQIVVVMGSLEMSGTAHGDVVSVMSRAHLAGTQLARVGSVERAPAGALELRDVHAPLGCVLLRPHDRALAAHDAARRRGLRGADEECLCQPFAVERPLHPDRRRRARKAGDAVVDRLRRGRSHDAGDLFGPEPQTTGYAFTYQFLDSIDNFLFALPRFKDKVLPTNRPFRAFVRSRARGFVPRLTEQQRLTPKNTVSICNDQALLPLPKDAPQHDGGNHAGINQVPKHASRAH